MTRFLYSLLLLLTLFTTVQTFFVMPLVRPHLRPEVQDATTGNTNIYATEGSMFDITQGPGHHLIDVAPKDLQSFEEEKSVKVHEMKVDASTLTVVSFGFLAFLLFVLPFIGFIELE